MNPAYFEFQQLRIKHILYKSKVRSCVYGGEFDETFFSTSGPVNVWMNTVAIPKYGQEPEIRELIKVHMDLNKIARSLYAMYRSGKIEEAREGLKDMEEKSERFLFLISSFLKRMES